MGGPRGRMISDSDRHRAVELIDEARESGARLKPACDVLCMSTRTYQRWVKGGNVNCDGRPTAERPVPVNSLSEEERQEVLDTVNSSKYASQPPSQIVPDLADNGVYIASTSTFYRIMRIEKLLKHRGNSKSPSRYKPTTYEATAPNQVWTWDITWLPGMIKGFFFKLYLILDIFSRFIVGWEVWEEETEEYASELIRRTVICEKIGIRGEENPLVVHSDNGSPMKGATFQATLQFLGIERSYSRPRVSNDNPYSESQFRTLKSRPNFKARGFKDIEEAREWVARFVNWYNEEHHHSSIGFVTPSQRHHGEAELIIANRIEVYQQARERHPERWTRDICRWELPESVFLNPEKNNQENLSV